MISCSIYSINVQLLNTPIYLDKGKEINIPADILDLPISL